MSDGAIADSDAAAAAKKAEANRKKREKAKAKKQLAKAAQDAPAPAAAEPASAAEAASKPAAALPSWWDEAAPAVLSSPSKAAAQPPAPDDEAAGGILRGTKRLSKLLSGMTGGLLGGGQYEERDLGADDEALEQAPEAGKLPDWWLDSTPGRAMRPDPSSPRVPQGGQYTSMPPIAAFASPEVASAAAVTAQPCISVEPIASLPTVEKVYSPNVYPFPPALCTAVAAAQQPAAPLATAGSAMEDTLASLQASPSKPPSILVPVSDSSEESISVVGSSASPSSSRDPNRLTSPIGTKLLHRKVHQQAGFEADDVDDKMSQDANQCSSPNSTELIHRKVAFQQRMGQSDPNQLSSPMGTALMRRKVHGQQHGQAGEQAVASTLAFVHEGVDEDEGVGELDDDYDHVNQCSSPRADELIHRKVAFQQRMGQSDPNQLSSPMGTDLMRRKAQWQQALEPPDGHPEACSSPRSDELMHRRVAFQQREGQTNPASQLESCVTSPVGAALLHRKMSRQQRMSPPEDGGGDGGGDGAGAEGEGRAGGAETPPPRSSQQRSPTFSMATASMASSCSSMSSLQPSLVPSLQPSPVVVQQPGAPPTGSQGGGAQEEGGAQISAAALSQVDVEAPAALGTPASTRWEAAGQQQAAAAEEVSPLARCLRCFAN